PNEDQNNQGSQVYQKSFFQTVFMQDISDESNDEVDNYLSLPEIFYKSNPFNWWNSQKAFFPIISKFARQYLTTPATSTPSERLFSDASNTITIRRTMLKPRLFERMLFLKHNNNELENIYAQANILER
ncbi:17832_t:CDS:1, partial [Gigaspora margarita]